MKKLFSLILGLALLSPIATSAADESVGLTRQMPSKEEVLSYWRNYRSRSAKTADFTGVQLLNSDGNLNDSATYQLMPNPQAGERGQLSQDAIDDSFHVINTYRYMSGLGEVSENPAYSSLAQAAAAVSYLNGGINHYPNTPAGLSDDLPMVIDGKQGAKDSNLAYGISTPFDFIKIYMDDYGPKNRNHLGHRRWILAPATKEMGVGYVGTFHALHVINSDSDFKNPEIIACPGANNISEFFGDSAKFSVLFGLGSGIDLSNAQVKVTDLKNGTSKTYTYGNGLVVSKQGYGYSHALIFGGELSKNPNYKYQVEIAGLTKDGMPYPISYTVNFFRAGPINYQKLDELVNELTNINMEYIGEANYQDYQKILNKLKKAKEDDSENQEYINSLVNNLQVGIRRIISASPKYQKRRDLVSRLRYAIKRASKNVGIVEESLNYRNYDKKTRDTLVFLVNKQKSNIEKIGKYADSLAKKYGIFDE